MQLRAVKEWELQEPDIASGTSWPWSKHEKCSKFILYSFLLLLCTSSQEQSSLGIKESYVANLYYNKSHNVHEKFLCLTFFVLSFNKLTQFMHQLSSEKVVFLWQQLKSSFLKRIFSSSPTTFLLAFLTIGNKKKSLKVMCMEDIFNKLKMIFKQEKGRKKKSKFRDVYLKIVN